jgi:DNA-binding IclR family transcriptional regulator
LDARFQIQMMKPSSLERMLGVLSLFSEEQASCTPERAAEALGASRSTTYRYFKTLTDAGLLVLQARGSYVLGPAIIEFDRLIRRHDPLMEVSRPVMRHLVEATGAETLLARLYRDRVVCIHREFTPPGYEVTYERGRPMSLFRTATARVMLARLGTRRLRRLFEAHKAEIRRSGLGSTWGKFTASLRAIREAGYCTQIDGVDDGFSGVAAAIADPAGEVETSLCLVVRSEPLRQQGDAHFAALVMRSARMISAALADPRAGRPARNGVMHE